MILVSIEFNENLEGPCMVNMVDTEREDSFMSIQVRDHIEAWRLFFELKINFLNEFNDGFNDGYIAGKM